MAHAPLRRPTRAHVMRLLLNVSLLAAIVTSASSTSRPGVAQPVAANAAADTTVRSPADTVREFRGLYETGFEVSWFHPCDAPKGDDVWWVTLTDHALRQRDSLAAKLTPQGASQGVMQGAVFVRWRGTTSAKMPMGAGHMGRGSRYMLVHEVLDLRPATGAGCSST
jgi:hypothetical protein